VAAATQCPLDNVKTTWPIIYKVAKKWGFDSRNNLVGLLGTFAKETASTMLPVREAFWTSEAWRKANLTRYYPYYGRGFIQLTWLSNYERLRDQTGIDVVSNPDLLVDNVELAAESAMVYWRDRTIGPQAELKNWDEVRKRVYGGSDPDGVARIKRIDSMLA